LRFWASEKRFMKEPSACIRSAGRVRPETGRPLAPCRLTLESSRKLNVTKRRPKHIFLDNWVENYRMCRRKKPVHLVIDGLPAHKGKVVKDYIKTTNGKLTLHVLSGYAPELNPDELVWSHAKRTGVAGRPPQKGENWPKKLISNCKLLRIHQHWFGRFSDILM